MHDWESRKALCELFEVGGMETEYLKEIYMQEQDIGVAEEMLLFFSAFGMEKRDLERILRFSQVLEGDVTARLLAELREYIRYRLMKLADEEARIEIASFIRKESEKADDSRLRERKNEENFQKIKEKLEETQFFHEEVGALLEECRSYRSQIEELETKMKRIQKEAERVSVPEGTSGDWWDQQGYSKESIFQDIGIQWSSIRKTRNPKKKPLIGRITFRLKRMWPICLIHTKILEHRVSVFQDAYLENMEYSKEQRQYFLSRFLGGDTVKDMRHYASKGLSVEEMESLRVMTARKR